MSNDASAAAASPMTNGTSLDGSHREADASTSVQQSSTDQTSLADVCADLNRRVNNFLNAEPETDSIKRTQAQTRIAVDVIAKALQDYE